MFIFFAVSLFTVFLVWLASLLFIYILFAWPTYLTSHPCPWHPSDFLPTILPVVSPRPSSLPLCGWQNSGHVLHIIAFKALQSHHPLKFALLIEWRAANDNKSGYSYAVLSRQKVVRVITACGGVENEVFFMQTFRSSRWTWIWPMTSWTIAGVVGKVLRKIKVFPRERKGFFSFFFWFVWWRFALLELCHKFNLINLVKVYY